MSVEQVLEALSGLRDPSAPPQAATLAAQLFEQAKAAERHAAVSVASQLVAREQPQEARNFGYGVLEHLVKLRWAEFTPEDRSQMMQLAVSLLVDVGNNGLGETWNLKCKVSALVSDIARQEGPPLWSSLVPQLLNFANTGPVQSELVALVLKWLPEEVTVHNDDLAVDRRRELLSGLTASLGQILPFLYTMMESNFGAAIGAMQQGNQAIAQAHAGAASAAVNACGSYGDWAPVAAVHQAGIIDACGALLAAQELRGGAIDVLRQLSSRKRTVDDKAAFEAAMLRLFEVVLTSVQNVTAAGEMGMLQHQEFVTRLCDTLSLAGQGHLHVLKGRPEQHEAFLAAMMGFAQHKILQVSMTTLPCWLSLVKEHRAAVAPGEGQQQQVGEGGGAGRGPVPLPAGCPQALLELASVRLVRQGVGWSSEEDSAWPSDEFDSYEDYRTFFNMYRNRIMELVRGIAAAEPALSTAIAAQRLDAALAAVAASQVGSSGDDAFGVMEGTACLLDAVLGAVPEAEFKVRGTPAESAAEAMLNKLLALPFAEPRFLILVGKCLESFHGFYRSGPPTISAVLSRLFAMIEMLPLGPAPGGHPLPASQRPPRWRENFTARQKIAAGVLTLAASASAAVAPQLPALAGKLESMWVAGQLLQGERNVLCDALMAAATAGDAAQAQEVLGYVLQPVKARWVEPAWPQTLSDVAQFAACFARVVPSGDVEGGGARFLLFHEIQLLDRAIRRPNTVGGPTGKTVAPGTLEEIGATATHPFRAHLDWSIPLVCGVIRCFNALWTPRGKSLLGPAVSALDIGGPERAVLLNQGITVALAAHASEDDEEGVAGVSINALRAFLKGTRETAYQVVSLAALRVGGFFDSPALAGSLVQVLSDLDSMGHHHLRLVIRTVVQSVVKLCPSAARRHFLGEILPALLPHMHARLTTSWARHIAGSQSAPEQQAGGVGGAGQSSLADEMINERMLRDLLREHCCLLQLMAGLDDKYGRKPVEALQGGESVLEWLLREVPAAAYAAVATGVAALSWPDADGAHKAVQFCRVVVPLAVKEPALHAAVGNDMLRAAISSLTSISNTDAQAEILGLVRDIVVRLGDSTPGPQEIFMSLPGVTVEVLQQLKAFLSGTGSEKEQRTYIKKLLLGTAAGDQLRALVDTHKTGVPIRNIADKSMIVRAPSSNQGEEDPWGINALFG